MFEPIPLDMFKHRIDTHLLMPDWGVATEIVSLRQIVSVETMAPMRRDYLNSLMTHVPLARDQNERVYAGCKIETLRVDPQTVSLGQTFVERAKYQQFLETFDTAFGSFCVARGVAKLGACIVLGRTAEGGYAIAQYIPPIIERIGDTWALLDGVHRMYIAGRIGTTLEAVVVSGVKTEFPASLHGWDAVSVVSEKPERSKRFSNLKPELFRDLKYVGLDG